MKQKYAPALAKVAKQHKAALDGLTAQQNTFWKKAALWVDITGGIRRNRKAAREALETAQEREKADMVTKAQELERTLREAIIGQHRGELALLRSERQNRLNRFYESHHDRQERENKEWFERRQDYEKARSELEQQLEFWRKDSSHDQEIKHEWD